MSEDDVEYSHIRNQIDKIDRLKGRAFDLGQLFGIIVTPAILTWFIDYYLDILQLPVRDYSLKVNAERMNNLTAESLTFSNTKLTLDMGTANRSAAIILTILALIFVLEFILSIIRIYRLDPKNPTTVDMNRGTNASRVNQEIISKAEYHVKGMGRKFWLSIFTALFGLYLMMIVTGRALGITIIHPIVQVMLLDVLLIIYTTAITLYLIIHALRFLTYYFENRQGKAIGTSLRRTYTGGLGTSSALVFIFLLFHIWASGIPSSIIKIYRSLELFVLHVILII